jgi:thiol:disulfide interchange protein
MSFASAAIIIAAMASGNEPTDYKTAYHRAMKGDKPLLVLVTAEWCRPCQAMKTTTIPALMAQHRFSEYNFATVDLDHQQKLARSLIQNQGVPQLILYEKQGDQWVKRHLVGWQSVTTVQSFLDASLTTRTAQTPSTLKGR